MPQGRGTTAGNVALVALVVTVLGSACATTPRAAAPTTRAAAAPFAATDHDDPNAAATTDDDSDDGAETADADASDREGSDKASGPCPAEMALIEAAGSQRFCIDKYEASLVEVLADGSERPFAHYIPVDGHDVRAVSRPHVFPQGYISEVQAQDACTASGKRLCKLDEWRTACMGPAHTVFPYGDARRPGACHDTGKSAVGAVFGAKALASSTPVMTTGHVNAKRVHTTKGRAAQMTRARAGAGAAKASAKTAKPSSKKAPHAKKSARPSSRVDVEPSVWTRLNDPALGQVEGALAKTAEHEQCVNGFGVFDMVGNLHEWVATDAAAPRGLFAGGYYLDTAQNGDGCNYKTGAHAHDYHDYSTGFRCCAVARPTE